MERERERERKKKKKERSNSANATGLHEISSSSLFNADRLRAARAALANVPSTLNFLIKK